MRCRASDEASICGKLAFLCGFDFLTPSVPGGFVLANEPQLIDDGIPRNALFSHQFLRGADDRTSACVPALPIAVSACFRSVFRNSQGSRQGGGCPGRECSAGLAEAHFGANFRVVPNLKVFGFRLIIDVPVP